MPPSGGKRSQKAQVILRDPHRLKATPGAGVEVVAVAEGAVRLRRGAAERKVFLRVTNVSLIADVAGSFWTSLDFRSRSVRVENR
jgi:hypothetical protein